MARTTIDRLIINMPYAEQDNVKRRYLQEWAQAVNACGGFGCWRCAVAKAPGEIRDILITNDATEK